MEPNPFYKPEYLRARYLVITRQKEIRAKQLIKTAKDKRAAVAVSGKDSIVALVLTAIASREEHFEFSVVISRYFVNREWPSSIVDELIQIAKQYANHIVIHNEKWDVHANLFALFAKKYGFNVIISGIRRKENGPHLAIERYPWGIVLNPIVDWSVADVWAFLFVNNVKVPSAYNNALLPWTRLQDLVF